MTTVVHGLRRRQNAPASSSSSSLYPGLTLPHVVGGRADRGAPVIIFLAGGVPDDERSFLPLASCFAATHTTVAMGLPGASPRRSSAREVPRWGYPFKALVRATDRTVRTAIGTRRRVSIVAHGDVGAHLAALYAKAHADVVEHLVFLDAQPPAFSRRRANLGGFVGNHVRRRLLFAMAFVLRAYRLESVARLLLLASSQQYSSLWGPRKRLLFGGANSDRTRRDATSTTSTTTTRAGCRETEDDSDDSVLSFAALLPPRAREWKRHPDVALCYPYYHMVRDALLTRLARRARALRRGLVAVLHHLFVSHHHHAKAPLVKQQQQQPEEEEDAAVTPASSLATDSDESDSDSDSAFWRRRLPRGVPVLFLFGTRAPAELRTSCFLDHLDERTDGSTWAALDSESHFVHAHLPDEIAAIIDLFFADVATKAKTTTKDATEVASSRRSGFLGSSSSNSRRAARPRRSR